MDGRSIAILGLALCMIFCGAGSCFGLFKTGTAAAGVLAEDGKKFSKIFVLSVLPATQGIYGFALALVKRGSAMALAVGSPAAEGWAIFGAALSLGITGMVSAILQGKTATAGIYAIAKNETISGKLILFPAMVETYAILSLVISIML